MKYLNYLPLLLLTLLVARPVCGQSSAFAVVEGWISFPDSFDGKTKKYFKEDMLVYPPYRGYEFNNYDGEHIRVDKKGYFRIKIPVLKPAIMLLKVNAVRHYLYVMPDSTVTVKLVISNLGGSEAIFSGPFANRNQLFNQLYYEREKGRGLVESMYIYRDSIPDSLYLSVAKSKFNELVKPLDDALQRGDVDSIFFRLAKRNMINRVLFLGSRFHVWRDGEASLSQEDDQKMQQRGGRLRDSLLAWVGELDTLDLQSVTFFEYPSKCRKIYTDSVQKGRTVYADFGIYGELCFLPQPFFEQVVYSGIMHNYEYRSRELQFLKAANLFLRIFPESPRNALLKQYIKNFKDSPVSYQREEEVTDTSRTILFYNLPDYQSIGLSKSGQNMRSLFSEIAQGRYLLIDFWATWCIPCIREFEHSGVLYDKIRKRNMQYVYVSIDDREKRKDWEDMIINKALMGCHLPVSKSLKEELQREIGLSAIPRYILIGPDGTVLDAALPRPSALQKLLENIDRIIPVSDQASL